MITYFTRDHARQLAPHLAGHPFLTGCEHMQLHLFSHVHACSTLTQRRQLTATVVHLLSLHIILLALHFYTHGGVSAYTLCTCNPATRSTVPFSSCFSPSTLHSGVPSRGRVKTCVRATKATCMQSSSSACGPCAAAAMPLPRPPLPQAVLAS